MMAVMLLASCLIVEGESVIASDLVASACGEGDLVRFQLPDTWPALEGGTDPARLIVTKPTCGPLLGVFSIFLRADGRAQCV